MQRLLPLDSAGPVDLPEAREDFDFPQPPGDRPWVRSVFVSSIDGAATGGDNLSGSLSSDHDRALFLFQRNLADVILVGAGTVRAERYRPVTAKDEHRQRRADRGQRPAPTLCIVSGRLDLNPTDPLFTESDERVIVATHSKADWERVEQLGEVADVIRTPGDTVDLPSLLSTLSQRGLTRIDCEGGPSLHNDLIRAGVLDELVLTLAPHLAGGTARRITSGAGPEVPYRMQCEAMLLDDDGGLFTRWTRRGHG